VPKRTAPTGHAGPLPTLMRLGFSTCNKPISQHVSPLAGKEATGQVRVEWPRRTNGQLVLRWAELGGPPVKPPTRKGFGTHVMEAMIRGHEGGDVRLDWRAEGLACEIVIPT
jgi:hypothetical protein